MSILTDEQRADLEKAWSNDSTRRGAASSALNIFRRRFDYQADDDTSDEGLEIGLLAGERKSLPTARRFVEKFEAFLAEREKHGF